MRRRARAAFTLVELLLTLGVAALLLLLLGAYMASARRAQQATEVGWQAGVALQLATELLREELRLAGSAPWPFPAEVVDTDQPQAFMQVPLQAWGAPGGSAIRLRYLDDRLAGAVVARDLTFEAAPDGRGQPQLYRRSGSDNRQPLVEGITQLLIVGGIDESGLPLAADQLQGRRLRAVWLQLGAADQQRSALFELPTQPRLAGP